MGETATKDTRETAQRVVFVTSKLDFIGVAGGCKVDTVHPYNKTSKNLLIL